MKLKALRLPDDLLHIVQYAMAIQGGPSRQITFLSSFNSNPAWSPDGTQIAFGSVGTPSDSG